MRRFYPPARITGGAAQDLAARGPRLDRVSIDERIDVICRWIERELAGG
jgi:hypothetical protein